MLRFVKKHLSLRLFSKHKQEFSDEELLTLIKNGESLSYFGQLYERYIPLIYGLCLKYLKNENQAQDAVIDIFENLSPRIESYDINNFKNWMYSVVRNHCFQVLRDNKKEIIVNFDSNIMESDSILDLLSEENTDKDKEMALSNCIQHLPEPQRITINKFFYEDKSYADIATETGFNLKSVKSFLQNGKRNLKICIEKRLRV